MTKLSSDRLQRVKNSEYEKNLPLSKPGISDCTILSKEVFIGDWCLFETVDGDKCNIGLVLSFAYTSGKTWKNIEYSNTFANVTGNKKPIGVLCHWFSVDDDGNLCLIKMSVHRYIPIEQYRLTLSPPIFTDIGLSLNRNIFIQIRSQL